MIKYSAENLENIKKLVSEKTGVSFSESRKSHIVTRNVILAAVVLILGTSTVFAVQQFRISKSFLEAPSADISSSEQIEQASLQSDRSLPPIPEPQAVSATEGEEPATVNGFIISAPFGDIPVGGLDMTVHHDGVDIAAERGTAVLAAAAGTVKEAGYTPSYGNYVVLDHADGYSTTYAHLQDILVSEGDTVAQGDQIGTVGSTGLSTGPHLHLELRCNGELLDPSEYWE